MKTYFIVSDTHSFYTPLINGLNEKGFDINNKNHILMVCGDLFDRGPESIEILEFIKSIPHDRRILIRGNHEYLFIDLLKKKAPDGYDFSNGTFKTLDDLTGNKYYNWEELTKDNRLNEIAEWFLSDEWIDYYETDKYIFTHAFIPLGMKELCHMYVAKVENLFYKENWRESSNDEFINATWGCPWKLTQAGLNKTGKIIVCGHWHTSDFFNNLMDLKEKYDKRDNPIFISKEYNLIGLDACTVRSNKINVLVLNEGEL